VARELLQRPGTGYQYRTGKNCANNPIVSMRPVGGIERSRRRDSRTWRYTLMLNTLVHNDFAPISSYGEVFESNPHTQRADGIADLLCSPPQKGTFSNHVNGDEFFHSNRFTQFADNIAKLLHLSPVNVNDYQWDSTPVGRWETLAKTLPAIVTCGSIVVERGNPHFKGPPLVECPRCKSKLTRGNCHAHLPKGAASHPSAGGRGLDLLVRRILRSG